MKDMVVIPERKSTKKLSVNGIESSFTVDKKIESVHGKLIEEEEEDDLKLPLKEKLNHREETVRGATRALLIKRNIQTMDDWIYFKTSSSYDNVYKWISNYLGRELIGNDKNSIRAEIHNKEWYVKSKDIL